MELIHQHPFDCNVIASLAPKEIDIIHFLPLCMHVIMHVYRNNKKKKVIQIMLGATQQSKEKQQSSIALRQEVSSLILKTKQK